MFIVSTAHEPGARPIIKVRWDRIIVVNVDHAIAKRTIDALARRLGYPVRYPPDFLTG